MYTKLVVCVFISAHRASWSPLMYLVAVHHLHSAMFNTTACEPTALQRRLLQSVMSLKDEVIIIIVPPPKLVFAITESTGSQDVSFWNAVRASLQYASTISDLYHLH